MTKVLILAAGVGSRLGHLTSDRPKCLVEFKDNPIIFYQLKNFFNAGLTDITFVGGYLSAKLLQFGLPLITNEEYRSTNMVKSLFTAHNLFDGENDLIISYADIITQPEIILDLQRQKGDHITVVSDLNWKRLWQLRLGENYLDDVESFQIDDDDQVLDLGRKVDDTRQVMGQYIGLLKIPRQYQHRLLSLYNSLAENYTFEGETPANMYMTTFLRLLIGRGFTVKSMPIKSGWLEIDTLKDIYAYNGLYRTDRLDEYCKIPQISSPSIILENYIESIKKGPSVNQIDKILVRFFRNTKSKIAQLDLIKLSRKVEISGVLYDDYSEDFKPFKQYGKCSRDRLIALLAALLIVAENEKKLYFANSVLKILDYSYLKNEFGALSLDLRFYTLKLVEQVLSND